LKGNTKRLVNHKNSEIDAKHDRISFLNIKCKCPQDYSIHFFPAQHADEDDEGFIPKKGENKKGKRL